MNNPRWHTGWTSACKVLQVLVAFLVFVTRADFVQSARGADDHGNTPATATPVEFGTITSGNLEVAGDLDYFSFTVETAGTYYFFTRGTTRVYGEIYDAGLRKFASSSPGDTPNNFRIAQALNPGTYYLRISYPFVGATAGPYQLHVEGPPPLSLPPSISNVRPNPVTGLNSRQTVTINGANFVNKPTVTLTARRLFTTLFSILSCN